MEYDMTNPYDIAKFIKDSKKSTPVTAYVMGDLKEVNEPLIDSYGNGEFYILFGESNEILKFIQNHQDKIMKYKIQYDRRNSAIPLLNTVCIDARIEPGSIIRDKVKIGKNSVIMMGAVINIGADIGDGAMIDMNAVIGARGKIGARTHIGAGAVIAGVLEPPSSKPCIIEEDVLIGANAVILEGIKVGKGAVVAAGSVVVSDVPPLVVVAGAPAKIIKNVDEKTLEKTKIIEDLRK